MEKKCGCGGGGCGKNRVPNRITVTLGEQEVSNRELACRCCAYKKRGDTAACFRYESKPDSVLAGGKCEFFLKECGDPFGKSSCSGCGDCK